MRALGPCPVCRMDYGDLQPEQVLVDGRVHTVYPTFLGGESWSDYALLRLMHQEWSRPLPTAPVFQEMPHGRRPSPRLALVLLFWSMFESMVTRLLEGSTRNLPPRVAADLLGRYSAVGARLDRLYKLLFGTTFWTDLAANGREDVAQHLARVQEQRNAFMHGDPQAISDDLVNDTVQLVPATVEAWIAVYNARCAQASAPSSSKR